MTNIATIENITKDVIIVGMRSIMKENVDTMSMIIMSVIITTTIMVTNFMRNGENMVVMKVNTMVMKRDITMVNMVVIITKIMILDIITTVVVVVVEVVEVVVVVEEEVEEEVGVEVGVDVVQEDVVKSLLYQSKLNIGQRKIWKTKMRR